MKWRIRGRHIEFLPDREIEAESLGEAMEKYEMMWSQGQIPAMGGDIELSQVKEN